MQPPTFLIRCLWANMGSGISQETMISLARLHRQEFLQRCFVCEAKSVKLGRVQGLFLGPHFRTARRPQNAQQRVKPDCLVSLFAARIRVRLAVPEPGPLFDTSRGLAISFWGVHTSCGKLDWSRGAVRPRTVRQVRNSSVVRIRAIAFACHMFLSS